MKKIFKFICIFTSIITIIISLFGVIFVYSSICLLPQPEINRVLQKDYSKVYDSTGRIVEVLGENKQLYIEYKDIPQILIDALVSIEDTQFFVHDGLNYKRIISSFFNNIFSSKTQGGSTLTQQLIKNLLLSNEHSLKRKVQEAYLALLLEKEMSKEEILEFYFNEIYFDGSIPGIYYACKKYFNKEVSSISIAEAAVLAGLVKSPTYYNPIRNTENCNTRKNIVLKTMYKNNFITYEEYHLNKQIHVKDLLNNQASTFQINNYAYQAYLDVVYSEVEELTSYNPYITPMKIETYLDTSLQTYLDSIQEGTSIKFIDDEQQIASSIINNNDGGIIGIIGGRNYKGERLYNRAYDMRRQPASTLKPIFTYLLAIEHLDYHEYSLLQDKPYTYPNSTITVKNSDNNYLGDITLLDAIGYSRNTTTLLTLEKVIKEIGIDRCVDFLKKINIMDEGIFSYPYALGGMKYGVSPTILAGAYSILSNKGYYIKPSTIKRITLLNDNKVIYERKLDKERVISEESAHVMSSILNKVIDKNYYNIGYAKPNNIIMGGKTGTNAYDSYIINKYNLPPYADRDIWFAGFSKNYTIATWTGFDEPKEGKNYFGKNDSRRLIAKEIFKNCLAKLELKNQSFSSSNLISKVNIVKGLPTDYLPNDLISSNYIVEASFKKGKEPTQVLPYPDFDKINNINLIKINETLQIEIQSTLKDDPLYKYLFGKKVYLITYGNNSYQSTDIIDTPYFELPYVDDSFNITICETFEKNTKITGDIYTFEYQPVI